MRKCQKKKKSLAKGCKGAFEQARRRRFKSKWLDLLPVAIGMAMSIACLKMEIDTFMKERSTHGYY